MQVLKEEIRKKILSTAENMFFELGFQQTTMRNIAEIVGISVSNLYLYYKNKEAIFADVVEGFNRYLFNELKLFLDHNDSDVNITEELSRMLKGMIANNYKKFVILMDKSQQTSYEGVKAQIIQSLKDHLGAQISKANKDNEVVFEIIITNFVNGIIDIAKHYKNEAWLEDALNTLVKYHTKGIELLFS
jgi:AcrR family transcriptional regulator